MRRLLVVLALVGLVGTACGDREPAEPADAGVRDVGGVQPGGEGSEGGLADDAEEMMLDELNVGYSWEWPAPSQAVQTERTHDDALGMFVNWIPLASGGDMAEALVAGDIDIAYSQDVTSFANSVTGGADLLLVAVAANYADADDCVAHPAYGVTLDNAAETLAGHSIYTPLGDATHLKLLRMLEHLGVDTTAVNLIQSEGSPAAVAAFDSGAVAMACAFGGAVNQMIANGGNRVMTGAEQQAIGIRTFGIISTSGTFAAEYPEAVIGFLQVTESANAAYNDDREPFIDIVAEAASMDRADAVALLDRFSFPAKDAQLADVWLGGAVQQVMKEQMDFLAARGGIEPALERYEAFVDTSFLEAIG